MRPPKTNRKSHECLKEADIAGMKKDIIHIKAENIAQNEVIKNNTDTINQVNITLKAVQTVMQQFIEDKKTWADRKWKIISGALLLVIGAIISYIL
ncbi:MAG: hypothetical protein ISP01_08710 [Methanobrevibacter arboriphilus]|uniref:Uncharacterized protein n=1 Tax=Methanobrevibacter arboriphilus TaxID=39441 RepID=A0A843APN9_METAZ|nr:hypothetical protein [Methanobrevibacter arboriphilus]MBF4469468.1 hypothetical protein [Methanobrevibacter arboriphilus]